MKSRIATVEEARQTPPAGTALPKRRTVSPFAMDVLLFVGAVLLSVLVLFPSLIASLFRNVAAMITGRAVVHSEHDAGLTDQTADAGASKTID